MSRLNKTEIFGLHLTQPLSPYTEEAPLNNSTQADEHNSKISPITVMTNQR